MCVRGACISTCRRNAGAKWINQWIKRESERRRKSGNALDGVDSGSLERV
jgi:hypothetical protein